MENVTLAALHILYIISLPGPNLVSKRFPHIKPLLVNRFVVGSIISKKRINGIDVTLATEMVQTITTTVI